MTMVSSRKRSLMYPKSGSALGSVEHSAAGKEYMGRKDVVDKPYFSDRGRFAEMINAVVYHGECVVHSENLVLRKRKYPSLRSSCGEAERDVLMEDTSRSICYGMEIETEADYGMPERVMVYDACEYEYQMREIDKMHRDEGDYADYRERKSRIKKSDHLLPMVTIVLYLGEGRWEGRQKLSQMCRLSAEAGNLLGKTFHDYDFPLAEADYMDPKGFGTDLKDFFQAMQCRRDREKLRMLLQTERFRHLGTETEQVIARHLHIGQTGKEWRRRRLPYVAWHLKKLMKEESQEGRKEGKKKKKLRTNQAE